MGEDWEKFWNKNNLSTAIINFGRHYYFSHIPMAYLGNIKGKTILEAGCGTCETLVKIAKRAKKVTGVDISKKVIEVAKRNFKENKIPDDKYELSIADIQQMDFKDDTFDITFNTGVVEHFDDEKINSKPVIEMIRVTKKGGKIVILVPSTYSPYYLFYLITRISWLKWLYPWEPHRNYSFRMLRQQLDELNLNYKIELCWRSLFTYLVAEIKK